jgi:hypothetical protein
MPWRNWPCDAIRELLVLLTRNDVWVYGDTNIRTLPESYELQPESSRGDCGMPAITSFGPPGEGTD